MKHNVITGICLLLACFSIAQDVTEPPAKVVLSISQLKSFGYSGQASDPKKQPITSKADALEFIKRVTALNDPALAAVRGQLDVYARMLDQQENDKFAVILIKHPLKLEKLFAENAVSQAALSTQFNNLMAKRTVLTDLVTSIDANVTGIVNATRATPGNAATAIVPGNVNAARVAELNNLKTLKDRTIQEIAEADKEIESVKSAYIKVSSEIEEDEKVEQMILDFRDEEWTDYLYDVDKVLYVLVGGPSDIQVGKLKIDNKPSSFEVSINEALQVLPGLGIPIPVGAASLATSVSLKTTIPVTFLLVKRKKIKVPSTLEFDMDGKEKKVKADIHEKKRFGLQFGFSAGYVDRKNFTINDQNELTVSVDDDKAKELKSNLYALLEVIPWGRDIDRLEPIFAKNKNIKFFDWNRLGLVFGVKISKSPLDALYAGGSYALSKTVSLNLGVSFQAIPKDVTDLPVGVNATLDYLKENADKELQPKFFFGISFSPLTLGRSLGVVK